MKWTLAILLTVMLLVPGLAPVATAQSAPSGFVGVPNENISADMPDGESPPIPASDLEGEVMASQYASTLDVTLTTPERAEQLMAGDGTVVGNGDVALLLSDDTNHDAREVALPSAAIEDALGYTPMEVRGYHESGDQWTRQVENRNGYLVFEVPKFSTNTVTFTGVVELTGSPASDGASYTYDVTDQEAVENFNITLTGSTATEWDNESFVASNGESGSISVAGTTEPSGPSANDEPVVVFEGRTSTSQFTASGAVSDGDTKTIDVGGNQAPQNETVTFEGVTNFNSRSQSGTASDGGSASVSVGGNAAPEQSDGTQPTITFTGNSGTTPGSASGTGATDGYSTTVDVGGDAAPQNAEITFTGTSPNTETDTFTVPKDGSSSSTIAGSVVLSSATVDVSWSHGDISHSTDPEGDSEGGIEDFFAGESESWYYSREDVADPSSISIDTRYHDSPILVELRDDGTTLASHTFDSSGGSFDTSAAETDGTFTIYMENTGSQNTRVQSFSVNGENPDSVDVTLDGATKTWTSQGQKTVTLDGDTSIDASTTAAGGGTVTTTIDYTETQQMLDPSVTVDSNTASHSGALANGETATISVSGLSTDSNSLSFGLGSTSSDAPSSPPVDWSLSYDETHYTNSPSVSLAGGGGASVSGDIAPGNTVTKSLDQLSTDSNSLSFSINGPASVDWTIDWTERTQTANPAVDVDGDGTDEAIVSGQLADGATESQSISLVKDSQTLNFSAGGSGQVGYTVTADEVTATTDPAVDLDNDGTFDITHVGTLSQGETVTKEAASIDTQTSTIRVSTQNSQVAVRVKLKERTQTQDVDVTINGQTTSYAGTLTDGETTSIQTDPAWIEEGTNQVEVTIGSGAGEAPPPKVGFEYHHDSLDQQSVDYEAEAWSERYNVSKTFGGSRSNAQLTIPFAGEVLSVRSIERQQDDGSWSDVAPANHDLNGTELTVELGSVSSGEEVAVRATGSKARVTGGEIQVTEPTVAGNTLDSKVKLVSWGPDAYISVPQQGEYNLIHYTYQESWTGADSEVTVEADGEQRLYMPAGTAGGTTQVTTLPVSAEPATGEVVVSVPDSHSNTEPSFRIAPGSNVGNDVQYTFVEAQDGESYILYDTSAEIVLDDGTANSPLTLSDDDSESTLQFQVDDGSTSTSGGGGGSSALPGPVPESADSFINSIPVVLVAAVVLIVGLYVLFRRMGWTDDGGVLPINDVLGLAIALIGFIVIDYVSGRVLTQALGVTLEQVGPLAGIIGTLLLAWYAYKNYIKGSGPRPIVFRGGGGGGQ
jgi:hypothetical protein